MPQTILGTYALGVQIIGSNNTVAVTFVKTESLKRHRRHKRKRWWNTRHVAIRVDPQVTRSRR